MLRKPQKRCFGSGSCCLFERSSFVYKPVWSRLLRIQTRIPAERNGSEKEPILAVDFEVLTSFSGES